MKGSIQCKYFDGKTSKAKKAVLHLEKFRWRIELIENKPSDVYWEIEHINKPEVYTSGFSTYTYSEIPRQVIEIDSPDFSEKLEQFYSNTALTRKGDSYIFKNKIKSISFMLIGFIAILLLGYFYIVPALSNTVINNLSPNTVVSIGNYFFNTLSSELDIDKKLSKKIQKFADEIEMDADFPMKVYVSNEKELNAFAMPGGNVVIYRELLGEIENENQLLALLGHEFTHTANRHALKNMANHLTGYLFLSAILGDANGFIAVIMENAHLIKQLSYSRELEREADEIGIKIIIENQADPNGMHQLFTILNNKNNIAIPEYLSTHPDMEDRIEYCKELATNLPVNNNDILHEKWMNIERAL